MFENIDETGGLMKLKRTIWALSAAACMLLAGCAGAGDEPENNTISDQSTENSTAEESITDSVADTANESTANSSSGSETAEGSVAAPSQEQQEPTDFKNGDHITRQLTEGVTLDAQIQAAKESGFKQYRAVITEFNAEELMPKILGYMPTEGLQVEDYGYFYEGNLGNFNENMNGSLYVSDSLTLETDHWSKIGANLPISSASTPFGSTTSLYDTGVTPQSGDFEFASMEEAIAEAEQYLKDVIGIEGVEIKQSFAINYEQMQAVYAVNETLPDLKPVQEGEQQTETTWGPEDNCYYLILEQKFNGLPVLSNTITRQDELYILSAEIKVGYTQNGIEHLSISNSYTQTEETDVSLKPIEEIISTLQTKFELTITDEMVIDHMKLIYYPFPISTNEVGQWEYDMIPAWEFAWEVRYDEQTAFDMYMYVNAVTGMEIVG